MLIYIAGSNGEDEQSLIKAYLQINGMKGNQQGAVKHLNSRGPFSPLDQREPGIICSCKKEPSAGTGIFGSKETLKK